jgi:hypothetical protein
MSQSLFANSTVAASVAAGPLPDEYQYGLSPVAATETHPMQASTPISPIVSLPLDIAVPKAALRRRNAVVEAILGSQVLAALSAVRGQPEPLLAA